MISEIEITRIIDSFEKLFEQRHQKLLDFQLGKIPYLVSVTGPGSFYTDCNSIERSFEANMADLNAAMKLPSDSLPFLEPWFGTGVYAQAFGCEYVWREKDSPACHYKYRTIDEVADITIPAINEDLIFKMVLDAIGYFKDRTRGKLPLCVTDTQSAHDTATLVLDAVEVFTASYSDPEKLSTFLQKINNLIVEFSKRQIEAIGECLVSPGHIMACSTRGGYGFSISDDNLAVASPQVNERFLLPYDEMIGEALGGLAIHSCGNWSHTMPTVAKMKSICMIDCAISSESDPNPNTPELVRDAFKGSNVIVQVRFGEDVDKELPLLGRVFDKDLRLIARVSGNSQCAQHQYDTLNNYLKELYGA